MRARAKVSWAPVKVTAVALAPVGRILGEDGDPEGEQADERGDEDPGEGGGADFCEAAVGGGVAADEADGRQGAFSDALAGDGDFLCHGGVPSSGECFLACCSWFCPAGFRARGLGWD